MTSTSLRGWRRVACAMWSAPRDPQIYGQLEIDAEPLIAFMRRARESGHHVTPTHLVARALTAAIEEVPELNVRIVGSRAHPRPRIEIFFITSLRTVGDDLSGVKVDTSNCNVFELAERLQHASQALHSENEAAFARAKRLLDRLPRPLLRLALHASALATERLQWDLSGLGLTRSPFGSAMISNIGPLGLPSGFAPLSWMYDVPLLVAIGELSERACVRDGKLAVGTVLPLCVTIDHRYVDGSHLSRALHALRAYLSSPEGCSD